jgi:hypothetical protein
MSMIEGVPSPTYDPVQAVLAHLPDGVYGTYEGLMNHLLLSPLVPMEIKEGLRYVSAVTIGCEFCRTFREVDGSGVRLLHDEFYAQVADGDARWEELVPVEWVPVFEMAVEVLDEAGTISATTLARLKENVSEAQIVEALFYVFVVGASHRLSHALGIPASCAVPAAAGAPGSSAVGAGAE